MVYQYLNIFPLIPTTSQSVDDNANNENVMYVNKIQTNAWKGRHDADTNNECWKLLQPKKSVSISVGSNKGTD